jgi:tRNA(Glu) U13 pseudouridine synthase TruD
MADRQEPFFYWPRTDSSALSAATLRAIPEDFGVEEQMPYTLAGAGEHLWVKLCKCGYNTEQVAKQIARTAGVTRREVATSYGSGDVETRVAACEQAAVCISYGNR